MRVQVPFSRGYRIGIVLELRDNSPLPLSDLRPVIRILDTDPVLTADMIRFLQWAQRYYHHPPGEVFANALPVLLRQGRSAQPHENRFWQITSAGFDMLQANGFKKAHRQKAVLTYLAQRPEGVADDQLKQAIPKATGCLRPLLSNGWIREVHKVASPWAQPATSSFPPTATLAQSQAVAAISEGFNRFAAFLLDGVTGSGKTEVYLRVVESILNRGQQALVLVPEIGLTPQLLARFESRLPGPLAVLHSGLTERQRLQAWLTAKSGAASVAIGTRSAIFTPLPRLGIIIVDEEHDTSFKQQEGFRYQARDLALVRARQNNIPVLLGSATPSLESLLNAQRGRYQRLRLAERVGNAVEPPIQLLDVRHRPMTEGLSDRLLAEMRNHLARHEQVLLFLNRRGFAPTLMCHECGWLCQCQRCDARMTVHLRDRKLICHHCGSERPVDEACTACGSIDLRALGQGTERIEQFLEQAFPGVGIARLDRDSTRRKGSLQTLLKEIRQGERRILIGTQMLAKGHDFPNVTLVAIVDADQGLFGVDFRASERMAQLIIQVAGRAGRADKPGVVLIQTHHPEHPLLRTLITQGYTAFAEAALGERYEACLPPFSYQALLRADAIKKEPVYHFLNEAQNLAVGLVRPVEVMGPVPAPMERRAGRYRAQLLIQAKQRRVLHDFLDEWTEQLTTLKLVRQVRWSLDVDPADLL
jgi:primosomal protein N' (replication factor Y)